ncbi:MAG: hypothetical protein ABL962_05590 [Fimbriimonadaceae bacterium]
MTVGVLEVGRTIRIRRRRAGGVDDTTDAIRAVACIRFVRAVVAVVHGLVFGGLAAFSD